jgi:hypothetical protein
MLSYFSCAYAARVFGFGWAAAAVAAFVFTFSPAMLAQDNHAQLIYRWAIPLAVVELCQILDSRRLDRLAWLGIWLALQFFCSIYLGCFLVMLLGAVAIASVYSASPTLQSSWSAPFHRQPPLQFLLIAASVVLWAGLALMLAKYHAVAREYHFSRDSAEIRSMLPRIGSYFLADRSRADAWIGAWVTNIPMRHEQQLFFGLVASILATIAVSAGRKSGPWSRAAYIQAFALLALVALTLSVGGFTLYRLFMKLPGFNSLRAVSRISLVMLLPVAWLSAIGIETVVERFARRSAPIFLSIAALLTIELLGFAPMHVPITQWRDRLSSLTGTWKVSVDGRPILYAMEDAPEQWKHIYRELDGMMLAQELGVPTINGYSGNLPSDFGSADSCMVAARRLTNGAILERLPPVELADMLRRITVLPRDIECSEFSALKPFQGALPEAVFHGVSISVLSVKPDGSDYVVTLEVANRSQDYLPALSTSDQAVQFSWQFVPAGESPSSSAWSTRQPLGADVPGGSSYRQTMRISPPTKAGRYRLAVSLVQDKVAWFQDKGMNIAFSNGLINVGSVP